MSERMTPAFSGTLPQAAVGPPLRPRRRLLGAARPPPADSTRASVIITKGEFDIFFVSVCDPNMNGAQRHSTWARGEITAGSVRLLCRLWCLQSASGSQVHVPLLSGYRNVTKKKNHTVGPC